MGILSTKDKALIVVIALSWGIALFEYMFQVPANRIGLAQFSVTQLKTFRSAFRYQFS